MLVAPSRSRRCMAFTLVEIVVAMIIIAIIAAMLYAAMGKISQSSRGVACISNLRAMSAAHAAYGADHQGQMIPCATPIKGKLKWHNVLDVYMGNTDDLGNERPKWQLCPAKVLPYKGPDVIGYGWNFQSFGLNPSGFIDATNPGAENFGPNRRFAEIERPAETIIIADSCDPDSGFSGWQNAIIYWGAPANDRSLAQRHGGKGHYLMVDGSVKRLSLAEVQARNYYLFKVTK
jgi:prepilin-type processing-associated H-X9-DG protein/prepilin-type N-terminal cleavage/methylation domain-containing protein